MPCDFPLKGYRRPHEAGDARLTFNPLKSLNSTNPITVPCGRCMGCRVDKSREWALRMVHESELYEHNCFVTLTFDDAHLPSDYGIHIPDVQKFMKRLRKSLSCSSYGEEPLDGVPRRSHAVRFYACGEYGDEKLRPHYHLILFNHDFFPKMFWGKSKRGERLFTSPALDKLWPYGLATIGSVSYSSAAYVARYVTKKITGARSVEHYTRLHPVTHDWHVVHPEFAVMSRRPGIGVPWLRKFASDVFPCDFVVHDGKKHPVPRFYEKVLSEEDLLMIKRRRKAAGLKYKSDQTPDRLRARAIVREARMSTLKRKL